MVSFLPVGTRLSRTLVVEDIAVLNPAPGTSKDPGLAEGSGIEPSYSENEHLALVRRVRVSEAQEPREEDEIEYTNKRLPATLLAPVPKTTLSASSWRSNEMLSLHARYEVPPGTHRGGVVLAQTRSLRLAHPES